MRMMESSEKRHRSLHGASGARLADLQLSVRTITTIASKSFAIAPGR